MRREGASTIGNQVSSSPFEVHVEEDLIYVVRLLGELDAAKVEDVATALREAAESDAETILLDIDRLSFIDSSGLAALLEASRSHALADRLKVTRGTGHVAEMLRLTGIDQAVPAPTPTMLMWARRSGSSGAESR